MIAYAHTLTHRPSTEWEPLFTPFGDGADQCQRENCQKCADLEPYHGHLNKVAFWAARFSSEMFAPDSAEAKSAWDWGYLAGIWHDLGKFSDDFQKRLRNEVPRANHSTAGAQYANEALGPIGHILCYLIAGHHAGLADLQRDKSSLLSRLSEQDYITPIRNIPETKPVIDQLCSVSIPDTLPCFPSPQSTSFFTRLLFSCLVDADFLATEAFMTPRQHEKRVQWPDNLFARMAQALAERINTFPPAETGTINAHRVVIHHYCLAAAEKQPGLFTLTVPTGGGKTLSSLAFAIRHAQKHDLHRIIYVIPYTSIIEQNASEFRDTFSKLEKEIGHPIVLEHHSNFDPSESKEQDETPVHKLLSENWDAPLVVTTNVQFFESLAHHKTSRCRKLHNLTRSVIILDEAQSLPPDHLTPCLDFLKQLTATARSTVVLCTATQPALSKLPENQPGDFTRSFNRIALPITQENEIIPDTRPLFNAFKRTNITLEDTPLTDSELAIRLQQHSRALAILNTKPHASRVFSIFDPDDPANLHLSAQLTPAHRQAILREIKLREETAQPCRLIATTVVEAGVDLSFPVLYRAMTGLDSFAQAVGRCNRHGKLKDHQGYPIPGQVHLFTPSEQPVPNFLKYAVNATTTVLPDFSNDPDELLSPDAISRYFQHAYWQHGGQSGRGWDKSEFSINFQFGNESAPFLFNFKTFSQNFHLILDTQAPVVIEPHPDYMPGLALESYQTIPVLLEKIRDADLKNCPPPPNSHRSLQRHTVQIPKNIHAALTATGDIQSYCDERFPILTHPLALYHPRLGFQIPDHIKPSISAFIV
jgi:CRISPR-associated endonuclease/helicase Cas3